MSCLHLNLNSFYSDGPRERLKCSKVRVNVLTEHVLETVVICRPRRRHTPPL